MILSKREIEVLELLSYGFEDKEIATKLQISTRTVQTYVTRLLLKLNARNRTNAVATFIKYYYAKYA